MVVDVMNVVSMRYDMVEVCNVKCCGCLVGVLNGFVK